MNCLVTLNYILQGIKNGFHIGFDRRQCICSATGNMYIEKPEVASEYLLREISYDVFFPTQHAAFSRFYEQGTYVSGW